MASNPRPVLLGLGANIGDRLQNLRAALLRLAAVGRLEAVSGLYQTTPVGVIDQPAFLNTVCALSTPLSLADLLREAKRIEWELGRRPARVWGPRPIDVDILLAGAEVIDAPDLKVPHPRLAERGFVLAPLAEIAPNVLHPILGKSVEQLLAALPEGEVAGVERIRGHEWVG